MKKIIDLTHVISENAPVFAGHPGIKIQYTLTVENDNRAIQTISFGNHAGTHMDAPSHFLAEGKTIEHLPVEHLFGSAVVLDFTSKSESQWITLEDLNTHRHVISEGSRLLLKTGWDSRFYSDRYFEAYPALTVEAANYLAAAKIQLLGMDTPSPGPADQRGAEIHRILLHANIIIVESLANLNQLSGNIYELIALPLPVAGCSGAPCRVVAVTEE